MLIPLIIGNTKYKVKPIAELTTAEFIELDKIENINLVKYIQWATGITLADAFFARHDVDTELAVGTIPDIRKLPRSKKFNYRNIIQTVGQRHQVESCGLEGYELLTFVLAVAMAQDSDIGKVHALRDQYLKQPFTEILPAGFFFYKILLNGRGFVRNSLGWLRSSMKIQSLRKRQVSLG